MRKLAVALLLLIVAGTAGYVGLQAYSRIEVERQVEAAFAGLAASGVTATHGEVHFDLLSRSLDISDVALSSPAGFTTIGRVVASGLAQPAPDRIGAARIEITDLTVDGPTRGEDDDATSAAMSVRIPTVVAEGYEGPVRFAAVQNGDVAAALRAIFTAVSAERISMPGAAVTLTVGTAPNLSVSKIRYGATVLEGLKSGVIASGTTEPSRMDITPPAASKPTLVSATFGAGRVERADLVASIFALAPAAPEDGDGFRTIYGLASMDSASLGLSNGVAINLGPLVITDLAMRPNEGLASRFTELVARGEEQAQTGATPDPAELIEGIYVLAEGWDSLRLGSLELSKLTATKPDNTQMLSLEHLKIGTLARGRLDNITLDGLSGTDAEDRPFSLDHLKVAGLRPADFLRLGGTAIESSTAEKTALRLALLKTVESIEITKFDAAAGSAADDRVKLDDFRLSWGSFVGSLPTRVTLKLAMEGPIGLASGDIFALLEEGGATRAAISIDFGANWNEADGTLTIGPFATHIPQAFASSGTIVMGGLDKDALSAAPDAALQSIAKATLERAEFNLADEGLYELKIAQVAEEQGASPDEVRDLVSGVAEFMTQGLVEQRPEFEPSAKAILAFLAEPKSTLALRITPRRPLPLQEMVQAIETEPTALIEDLDIEATVGK